MIIITTLLCLYAVKHRNDQEKLVRFTRIVVLTYSILGIILEIYKQLNFSFNSTSGEWSYQWYAFPFQFCSTPMYVGLIAGCCKEGGFQKFLYSYLATFALFAGLSVMFYPGDVFTRTIGINIQTMVCHGGMVVMGIYLWFSKQVKFEFKTILKALSVFLCSCGNCFDYEYYLQLNGKHCNIQYVLYQPIFTLHFANFKYDL